MNTDKNNHLQQFITYYHNNKQAESLENEIWVDCFGFDGVYEISNLGRIKSLTREVNTRWGTPRTIQGKILSQTFIKHKGRIDGLSAFLGRSGKNVPRIVFESFYPNVTISKNEWVMHINKICLDNRLDNLKKVTHKESKKTDLIKSNRTIISAPENIKKANAVNKNFYDNRTHKECSVCNAIDLVENFSKGVSKCNSCLNKYIVDRRKEYEYTGETKVCNTCLKEKKDILFPRLNNTCKECKAEAHKDYLVEQRNTIGTWYIKNYGKSKYKIKDFTEDILNKLKLEIIKNREPKHTIDNLNFSTKKDFAVYVSKTYKISKAAVEQRLSSGMTEYECTLKRSELQNFRKTIKL